MSGPKLTISDYPLAEKRPQIVRGPRGKSLEDITVAAVLDGRVTREDLAITGAALHQQAEIARAAGRPTVARNFERAAELVDIPESEIFRVYELLRPGRAQSRQDLINAAEVMRSVYRAHAIAALIEEAADVYERRRLLRERRDGQA